MDRGGAFAESGAGSAERPGDRGNVPLRQSRASKDRHATGTDAGPSGPPFLVDGCDTLTKLFLQRCRTHGGCAAQLAYLLADSGSCFLIGDRRRYLTALVMIDQENVERYAQEHRVPYSDFASLCAAEPVRALIGAEIGTVNTGFAQAEQVKDFRLIDVLLTPEDDELTPTMKIRRGIVERKHKALIDQMY